MTTQQTTPTSAHHDLGPAPTDGGSHTAPWMLVASREIVVRLTNKTFLVSTLVTLLFIAGYAAFAVVQSQSTTTHTVAVTGPDATAIVTSTGETMHAADDTVTVVADAVGGEPAARAALASGDADAWLHEVGSGWVLTAEKAPDTALAAAVTEAVRTRALTTNAEAAGTTIAALEQGSGLTTSQLQPAGQDTTFVKVVTFAFALLFFLAAQMFGQQIAASVVEEKQSRLVEIIATAIPLRQLLAGKVLGNALIALAQVVLFAGMGLVALSFTDWSSLLPSVSAAVLWFVVFFAVGFFALACLFAVAGALASRIEDLQSTTAPMTIALMLVYVLGFGLTGTAQVVASYVPIASVVSMPGRVLAGEAAWWEPVVSLALMGVFAALTVRVGERIYRRSLMQTRGKISWKQALTSAD
ncbi:MAG: ABC transporter permease [Terracoccus sp.]